MGRITEYLQILMIKKVENTYNFVFKKEEKLSTYYKHG